MEATNDVGHVPTEPPPADTNAEQPPPRALSPMEARLLTVTEAITVWRRALEAAADAKWAAEELEAATLITADGKNEAVRKAQATLASADLHRKAAHAQAIALAAEAMVVALVGHPIGGRR